MHAGERQAPSGHTALPPGRSILDTPCLMAHGAGRCFDFSLIFFDSFQVRMPGENLTKPNLQAWEIPAREPVTFRQITTCKKGTSEPLHKITHPKKGVSLTRAPPLRPPHTVLG
jgi:hypothetical protein